MSQAGKDEPKCATCRYVFFDHTKQLSAYCRRYPPTNFVIGQTAMLGQTVSPITGAFFPGVGTGVEIWCGEYSPQLTKPAEVTTLTPKADETQPTL